MTTTKTKDWNESHSLAFRLCFCTDAFDAAACTLDIRRAHIFTVIFIHFNFFLLNFVSLVRFCLVCPSIYSSLLSLCQFKHYTIGSLCHLVFASQLFKWKWKWKQSKSCEKKIHLLRSFPCIFVIIFNSCYSKHDAWKGRNSLFPIYVHSLRCQWYFRVFDWSFLTFLLASSLCECAFGFFVCKFM